LALLHAAALAACDRDDGLQDSLIGDPRRCRVDPARLQCTPASQAGGGCLTPEQVAAATRVYAGLVDPGDGRTLYPGLAPGSEQGWVAFATPGRPFPIPVSYYRWLVFADSTWDWRSYDPARPSDRRAVAEAERRDAPILSAVDPNLRAFRERGGKLIQYHGWNDQLISAQNSIDYYESVVAREAAGGRDRAALRDVQQFYRLFMVPGMAHCGGGEGPNTFDKVGPLEKWVEQGKAPERLEASHSTNGQVDRTRPLCPYPQVARYKGTGSIDEAANFVCRMP
jgi:feruloyl esterase